jgi:hypothetical protein
MWSGTQGEYCQNDSRGFIIMPDGHPIGVSELNLNYHGFYERITTLPPLGENQVRDQEVWGFADNKISLTWTVRDLTVTEIDQRTAAAMDLAVYLVYKLLVNRNVVNAQQLRAYLETNYPQLIDAYEARDRLENP